MIEDPGGSEDFKYGGWSFEIDRGEDGNQFKLDETMGSAALLLGRKTYEGFADAWPSREGEFADKFNNMPKYVVSSTLKDPDWTNTTVLDGDVAESVAKLRDEVDGDIVVHGSAQLTQALIDDGLVDELRLMVFPVVLGSGKRLFGETSDKKRAEAHRLEDRRRRRDDPDLRARVIIVAGSLLRRPRGAGRLPGRLPRSGGRRPGGARLPGLRAVARPAGARPDQRLRALGVGVSPRGLPRLGPARRPARPTSRDPRQRVRGQKGRSVMGEIHVHEFMSLDGVIDAPTWTFDYGFDPKMGEAIGAVTERSSGILLGRITYEMFEPAWSTRTVEDDPGRAVLQRHHQVRRVGDARRTATWRNSEIVGPYDPDAIRRLKDEVDGDLYVSGSGMLVRAMLEDGLVDELHLFVFPLTRGAGPRLFPDDAPPRKFSLARTESYDNGVVYLAYRPETA